MVHIRIGTFSLCYNQHYDDKEFLNTDEFTFFNICDKRWCSLFNADLALSVTMTAISTMISLLMLPLNLLLYAKLTYEEDILGSIDWVALFVSLAVVILAITSGLYVSAKLNSFKINILANKVRMQLLFDVDDDLFMSYH